jgi:hypothetical protein
MLRAMLLAAALLAPNRGRRSARPDARRAWPARLAATGTEDRPDIHARVGFAL